MLQKTAFFHLFEFKFFYAVCFLKINYLFCPLVETTERGLHRVRPVHAELPPHDHPGRGLAVALDRVAAGLAVEAGVQGIKGLFKGLRINFSFFYVCKHLPLCLFISLSVSPSLILSSSLSLSPSLSLALFLSLPFSLSLSLSLSFSFSLLSLPLFQFNLTRKAFPV